MEHMMQLGTDAVWVVVYRSTHPGRSRDTEMPEEVFMTRESALAYCAELNAAPKTFSWQPDNPYQVLTLRARLDELRDNLKEAGAQDEREWRDFIS
jgi:hypothetical protein